MIETLRRSMLLHLALIFAAGMSLVVGGAGLYLHASVTHAVYAQVNRDLIDSARLTLHRLEEDKMGLDKELLDLGDNVYLRVMRPSREVVLESKDMSQLLPREAPVPLGSWLWWESPRKSPIRVKVVSFRYQGGWIQLARDMHPEEGVLKDFRRSLLVLLSIIPFASAALGFGLLSLGFLPLERLRSKAGDIGPETLQSRIDPSPFPKELDPLVQTVNQALGKLESGFTRLSELNSDLAHELRTPVHALRLECESLLSRGDLTEQAMDQLESMMETLVHMGAVIEQMLVLARFEDPSTSITPVLLQAGALIREAVAPFEPLAEEKGLAIELASSRGLSFMGDATLLKRALHNLLGNAIRHAPEGSRIRLSALREGDAAVLAVSDQGEGIPAGVLGQLGRRFVREDASRSRQSGGAGLGLAIVHGIARLHGGALSLQSTEGRGTVAKITIPTP
ncbi:ATP-binding protein [Geothrix terrae]|uniref:ATP-binding protein n=1 Tax=Geothrix terrae TaxID=2922720 RepID=UPI001FAC396D|nr:ATP-binding protein [Geothrix terrae]